MGAVSTKTKDRYVRQMIMGVDVTEVYSPERVTAMARELGMTAGWAFDLTTSDEQGRPWDLSNPETQQKAVKKCQADRPYLLIGSPPCTPFSRVQFFNCNRGDPAMKAIKLEQSIEHIKFCVKPYRMQMDRGLDFLHGHPHAADSWKIREIQQPSENERVMKVRGDMCAYGSKTWGTNASINKNSQGKPRASRPTLHTSPTR